MSSHPTNVYQTRLLYEESRKNLCNKLANNIQSTGSVCRQIVKGSKSNDILSSVAKNFSSCDTQIITTELNLKKIGLTIKHFDEQLGTIDRKIDSNLTKII